MFDMVKAKQINNFFKAMLETSQDMFFFKDLNLVYVTASKSFVNMVGLESIDEIVGKTDYDIFDKELAQKYICDDKQLFSTGKPILHFIESLPTENGKKRYSSTSKYLVYNENGETMGMYGVATDVTSTMELEDSKESQQRLNQFYLGVIEFDLTENKLINYESYSDFANMSFLISDATTFCSFCDYVVKELVVKGFKEEFQELLTLKNLISNYEKGLNIFCFRTKLKNNNGEIWVELRLQVFYSRFSNTIRAKVFSRNINDAVNAEMKLKLKAEQDSLTGLLNRDGVVGQIRNCLKGYGEKKKHALLFLDLDNFKCINDTYGHKIGDKALKRVADILKNLCREDCIVGRIGGDEFIILMKNVSKEELVEIRMQNICNKIAENEKNDEENIPLSCSIGCTFYNGNGKRFTDLYEEADKAMYQAKELGKSRYFIHR